MRVNSAHLLQVVIMAEVELLKLSSLVDLVNLRGAYFLGYGVLLGMSFWVTFVGGVIAHRALPRQQFGALQHRVFPAYFKTSIVLTGGLLYLWYYGHPTVLEHVLQPQVADVAQTYALASIVIGQTLNLAVIGPLTSKTMFERYQLEKDEGKSYNDPDVSPKMKAITSRFMQLHGISSLLNLGAFIATSFHGLWIASKGLGSL
ncbi:hypothetical protein BDW22DRAFT_1111710 [Trametopsis cervina]|nr:hypothetical protein BDW22DRAFT_1111710 [Trametopsis cervina]